MIKTLLEDTREIEGVYRDGSWWAVGIDGCTSIIAYPEMGQMAHVPWFAIFNGDDIVKRVDAAGHLVVYACGDEPEVEG